MSALHLIGGEKGGVGKSFMARLLSQYLIDRFPNTLIGFDSDGSHGTFSRFYGDFTNQVSIDDFASLDQIIDTLEANPDANAVLDLAAQTAKGLNKWMQDSDLPAILRELESKIYYWHVMDTGADSMFLLDKFLDNYSANDMQLVIVQNYGRGNSFKDFENSTVLRKAKEKQAQIVLIANLQMELSKKLDFNSLSFWSGANNRSVMKTVERHRVKVWLNFCYEQLDRIIHKQRQDINTVQSYPSQPSMYTQQQGDAPFPATVATTIEDKENY